VFAPDGMSFVFHTHTWLYGLLWAGLQAPWRLMPALGVPPSPVLAYNVFSLGSTMLTGAAAAMLVRACGIVSPLGSILAALTVAFCGLRQVAMFGHLNFMATEFFVASVAAHTLAMQEAGRSRWWAAGGSLAGLAFLNDQTLGMFSLYFLAAACVYAVILRRTPGIWAALGGPALSAALAFAVSAPHLIELARVWRSADYVVMQTDDPRAADLVNAVLPGRLSWPFGSWAGRVRTATGVSGGDGTAYLGLQALAALIGACGLWRSPR
jgi:4-amino-4-deoxy-L-arabinose transferase-like glycosyltransferase